MRAVRALRLISGFGVRLREMPDGTFINFDGSQQIFDHPWRCTLQGGTACRVNPGLVNKVMVSIKGIPLTGDEEHAAPTLEFKDGVRLDAEGKGWIAIEVTCSEKDWSLAPKGVEIVQVADLNTEDGNAPKDAAASLSNPGGAPNIRGRRARHPIAMLKKLPSTGLKLRQVTFFNQTHRVRTDDKDPKADAGRHFFFPEG